MSKEDNINFLKIQTCVLKVNIHCDGCKKKVKKLLHKIEGVYHTSIDAEQGKVIVSGNVDPATLIKKLNKAGKHAEFWGSKGGNNQNLSNQLQKLQLENGKGQQKDNGKLQKGGGWGGGGFGGGKDQKGQQPTPQQQQQLQLLQQQMKGLKDMKFPQLKDLKLPFQKDQKQVKFSLPPEGDGDEGSDCDDEFDDFDDDDDFDDMDGFDDDFDYDPKMMKPMNVQPNWNGMANDKKGGGGGGGGGNGKKGGGGGGRVEIPVQNKAMGGNNGNNGGGKKGGGKNGGGPQDGKNGGGNNNKGPPDGHGGNNANNGNPANGGKKGGGKNDGVGGVQPMGNHPNMMGQGFQGMDLGRTGNMHRAPMGHMGNIPAGAAVQGLPAGAVPPGYFQGGMVAPEMIAAANPYQQQQQQQLQQQQLQQQQLQQQQYMAALMQQQRMMMNGQAAGAAAYPPPAMAYGYGRPQPYVPMPPPHGDPYTNFFSDENPNSCSIM